MLFQNVPIHHLAHIFGQEERSAPTQNKTKIRSLVVRAKAESNTEGLNGPMAFHRVYGDQNYDFG